jgi:cell division protease FtsH
VLLAGTVAEEMIYDDISTGAQNDLERATEIARSMIMDYGMSPLGRVTYRENRRSPFLSGADDFARDRSHSEQTAREIDEEIRSIVSQSLEKVRHILETRRKALVAMAERLIEKEVIDMAELKDLVESNSPTPQIVPGTDETPKRRAADEIAQPETKAESG